MEEAPALADLTHLWNCRELFAGVGGGGGALSRGGSQSVRSEQAPSGCCVGNRPGGGNEQVTESAQASGTGAVEVCEAV